MTLDEALKHIEGLAARDDADLMRLQGVGPKSAKAIREAAQVLTLATDSLKRIEDLERRVRELEARTTPLALVGYPHPMHSTVAGVIGQEPD